MKTIKIVLPLLILLYMEPASAQLEITSTRFLSKPFAITLNENVYLTSGFDHFLRFDDHPVTISFPIRDGLRLKYHKYNNEMVEYRNFLYMVFYNEEIYSSNVLESERYFYRFDGSSFEEISLPGKPVSTPVVFQDRIYILVDTGGEVKLFNHDGFTLNEIPSTELPLDQRFSLIATNNFIYAAGTGEGLSNIKRFDGTNVFVLPQISPDYNSFLNIKEIPGSDNIYIIYQGLYYFNGTSINEVFPQNPGNIEVINGNFYFILENAAGPLYRIEEGRIEQIILPDDGNAIEHIDFKSIGNKLYIPTSFPDSSGALFEYDGSTFLRKLDLLSHGWANYSYNREDKLLMVMTYQPLRDTYSKIYDFSGESLSIIDLPDGFWEAQYLASTSGHHLWFVTKYELFKGYIYYIAKEEKKLNPGISIIPDHVRRFERAEFGINGRYRDWCWSDIFWDWEINPECPFCSEPRFEASMTDAKGNIAWKEAFQIPFNLKKIPLDDKQAYRFTLADVSGKIKQNLFVFDEKLVSNGISSIEMNMLPSKEYFHLKAETKDGKNIPFMMSLLNDKGETIWKSEFMAPMNGEILAKVDKPGASLQFSAITNDFKEQNFSLKMKSAPNPFYDKLEVEIQSFDKKETNVELSIINLNGQTLYRKNLVTPAVESINLSNQKSGIYILRMISGSEVRTRLIKLER